MAEERKKRRSRRAYLNDFHLNDKGDYVYKGKMMGFIEEPVTYRQYLYRTIGAAVLVFVLTVAAECLPAVAMSRFGLTMIPWLGQIILASLVIYAAWQIFSGKNPMREYVYKASVGKLPIKLLLMAVFSFLTAGAETVYILINGCAGEVAFTILRPVLSLICGLTAVNHYRLVKNTGWTQVTEDEG